MSKTITCLVMLLLSAGCASTPPDSKKLAIISLTCRDRERTVYLPNDYGFLIKWLDVNAPEFYLYDKPSDRIRHTTDFSNFLAGLREFPDGAKVDWIRKCTAPFFWAMPAEYHKRLEKTIKDKGFALTTQEHGNFMICTCESREVELLKSSNSP